MMYLWVYTAVDDNVCTSDAGISDEPSETIVIKNVTRYSDDLYECVASNGVPPAAVRRTRVTVECQYHYTTLCRLSAPCKFSKCSVDLHSANNL